MEKSTAQVIKEQKRQEKRFEPEFLKDLKRKRKLELNPVNGYTYEQIQTMLENYSVADASRFIGCTEAQLYNFISYHKQRIKKGKR